MISTPRLALEPLTVAHADLLFAGLSDPSLYSFIPSNPPVSVDDLHERYTRILRGPQDSPGEIWLNWAVQEIATCDYNGFVETSTLPDH